MVVIFMVHTTSAVLEACARAQKTGRLGSADVACLPTARTRALQLRDQKHEIEEDTRKNCLICGQDANLFDRVVERGFTGHVKYAHNMWHYLYFIVYLNQKPEDEYTGTALIRLIRWAALGQWPQGRVQPRASGYHKPCDIPAGQG